MPRRKVGEHPNVETLSDGSLRCERCQTKVKPKKRGEKPDETAQQLLGIDCSVDPAKVEIEKHLV